LRLKQATGIGLGLLLGQMAGAEELARRLPQLDLALSPAPNKVVYRYLSGIAHEQLARRQKRISEINTQEQLEQRRQEIQRTVRRLIGGLPEGRTPLNVRKTGTIDRAGYRIEKIVYESLPKFFVTGTLHIPQTGSPPYPAVFLASGHEQEAKAGANNQLLALGLVQRGFVVLTIDPVGQGERQIFYDEQIQGSRVGKGSNEHQMAGVANILAGESVARYFIWDAIRGIDLLQSLKEVDGRRIGITGCSGGGMLTAYVAALDERIQAAAPGCWISAWEDQVDTRGPEDAEQHFHEQLAAGINHGDYILAFAPKPYLICATEDDFFPIQGARRTYAEVRRIYGAVGAADAVNLFVAPGGHGFRDSTRKAIFDWMTQWLRPLSAAAVPENTGVIENENDLYVTSTGQVTTALDSDTPSSSNIKRFAGIVPARPELKSQGDWERWQARIKSDVLALTHYEPSRAPLHIRRFGSIRRDSYEIEQLVYDADRGRYVPALLCRPAGAVSRKAAVIYVDQRGRFAALEEGAGGDLLARAGYTVLAIDVAGAAGTVLEPQTGPSAVSGSNQDVSWLALLVGRTLVGVQMADIIRGLDVLGDRGLLDDGRAIGFGKGLAAVALLHATAIDSRIAGVAIEESLVSFRAIAETPLHARGIMQTVIPHVLGRYDLQDLAGAIAPRPVRLVDLRSPLGLAMLLPKVQSDYEYAREAYRALGADARLRVDVRRAGENAASAAAWIGSNRSNP
jgi:dienelactone hydrolase